MTQNTTLEQVTENTRHWKSGLDIVSPIDTSQIKGFVRWISWQGFKTWRDHEGYDFAAYMDDKGRCFLGLPRSTYVRSVADGIVFHEIAYRNRNGKYILGAAENGYKRHDYYTAIEVAHGNPASGCLVSYYLHVVPLVEEQSFVRKGETIGKLYAEPGTQLGELIHLHFELIESQDEDRCIDPAVILPGLNEFVARPQGADIFKIKGLRPQPQVHIANYQALRK